jgi:hypothetical protein
MLRPTKRGQKKNFQVSISLKDKEVFFQVISFITTFKQQIHLFSILDRKKPKIETD